MDKIPENFRRHIFKVQNRELNLSIKEPKSVWKKVVSYIHLKINVLFIIQGHILFIFHRKCFYFSCTKYNTSFKLSDLFFQGAWKPALNISTVLTSIQLLMAEPNPDDPLVAEIVIIILLHCTSVAFISRDMTCIIGDHIIFKLSTVISTHNIIICNQHNYIVYHVCHMTQDSQQSVAQWQSIWASSRKLIGLTSAGKIQIFSESPASLTEVT